VPLESGSSRIQELVRYGSVKDPFTAHSFTAKIQNWEGYRSVKNTGISRIRACQGYRFGKDTGLKRIQGWKGYRSGKDTGLLGIRVCQGYRSGNVRQFAALHAESNILNLDDLDKVLTRNSYT
jgi:hypothetical protein